MVDKFNVVPGLKTSTVFFTFLRANLVVSPSPMSTPYLEPASSRALPPLSPSPSPLVTIDNDDDGDPPAAGAGTEKSPRPGPGSVPDDLPPLTVRALDGEADKVAALRLVADSIAQQRQSASRHLVFHPYLLAGLAAALALSYQVSWRARRDLGMALMLHSGVVMTYLLAIRYATGRYIQVAEGLRWAWLVPSSGNKGDGAGAGAGAGEEDTVIGVRFGSELIGALVLRLEPSPGQSQSHVGKKRTRHVLKGGHGVIRAWTVKLKYRRRGVGTDLLHEAVRVTRERCGRDAEVGFAKEHANSTMVLPEVFNGQFRKNEQRAAKAMENVVSEWEGAKRKRRKF
ncbi:hypothetical protein SLS62_003950 [Diatrype stigma]|uniref:N-acetyltransferase domain-containing protein n=1 Tax=Diatrype stigma TaxID=117547 RepID=A0AAN9URN7_9PEZI